MDEVNALDLISPVRMTSLSDFPGLTKCFKCFDTVVWAAVKVKIRCS